MSDLVGNPEDRFSQNGAHCICRYLKNKFPEEVIQAISKALWLSGTKKSSILERGRPNVFGVLQGKGIQLKCLK